MTRRPRQCRRAFLTLELMVAIVVAAILMQLSWSMMAAHRRVEDYIVTHRRLQLGAESLMERIRAGALPAEGTTIRDAADRCEYRVSVSAGQGQWSGLTRVVIHATAVARPQKQVSLVLRGYVPAVEVGP